MTTDRLLIAGVGNIFLGDDAFGVEVAQRLGQRRLPEGVRVVDFGIRGLDLVYALLDGYETVIIVDAAPCGSPVGTLHILEVDPQQFAAHASPDLLLVSHNLDPVKVLRLASGLGATVGRLLVVGCEPDTSRDPEEMQMEISVPVRAAVDEAIVLIETLVERLLRGEAVEASVAVG